MLQTLSFTELSSVSTQMKKLWNAYRDRSATAVSATRDGRTSSLLRGYYSFWESWSWIWSRR